MAKDRKELEYWHQMFGTMIAQSKTPLESQGECNGNGQIEGSYETVEPAQAPPIFEEGGKLPKTSSRG